MSDWMTVLHGRQIIRERVERAREPRRARRAVRRAQERIATPSRQ